MKGPSKSETTRLKMDKWFLQSLGTNEVISLEVPLASSSSSSIPARYPPLCIDWRSTREMEKRNGWWLLGDVTWEQCNLRGVEDTGVRGANSTRRAQSVYSATMDSSTVMSSGFPPRKETKTRSALKIINLLGRSLTRMTDTLPAVFEDSPLTFSPLSQANWAKGDM